jgi:hypothetical protein
VARFFPVEREAPEPRFGRPRISIARFFHTLSKARQMPKQSGIQICLEGIYSEEVAPIRELGAVELSELSEASASAPSRSDM